MRSRWGDVSSLPCAIAILLTICAALSFPAAAGSPQINNWAIIVSTSRYWHNYRHTANALSFYHLCKQNGIPDERIILFLGDNVACNPRNPEPATIFNNDRRTTNLYRCDTRVDYAGYDVSVRSLLEVMQGKFQPGSPHSRRLLSDRGTNLFVFLSGHGGNGFLKFQDVETLHTEELGATFTTMHTLGLYGKVLLVLDTCHAESMCLSITAPNVACIASSTVDEDSYAHHKDLRIGVDVIDRFTYEVLEELDGKTCSGSPRTYRRSVHDLIFGSRKSYRAAFRGPVNDAGLIYRWPISDFLCDSEVLTNSEGRNKGQTLPRDPLIL